jgi:DNA-binding transcriptional MocR family regulator
MLEQKYISGRSSVNIARSVESAAASGRAGAGDLLPPVRTLAAHLGVAPATVSAAYRRLQSRGITVADGRRGTRIRPTAPHPAAATIPLPRGVRDLAEGNPDRALLPNLQRAVRKLKVGQRLYGEEFNGRQLVAFARRLFRAEGVPARGVAVVGGALDGIERVLRERLRPGDRVIVEDPAFSGVLDLLAALALIPVAVEVDDEGMLPKDLARAMRTAAAVIVTPRAQNPTGAALTRRRALQLRKVLRARLDLLLIEDDHAGPISGAPYVTLVEKAREHWAVIRSVAKSLGPDLRVAVVAADDQTIAAVERRQTVGMRWVSHVLQELVLTLWSDRRVRADLAAAEKTYTTRRNALIRALANHGIDAWGRSGLNVWIPVPEESAIVQALYQRGWGVKAGERYRLATGPAIRVTVASLAPADARRLAADLAEIVSGRTLLSSRA